MWPAIAAIASAVISGATQYAGTQSANARNSAQAMMQQANSWNMMEAQNNYNIAAFDREKEFTRDQYQFETDNNRLNAAQDFARSQLLQDRQMTYGAGQQELAQQFAREQQAAQFDFERNNMNTAMAFNAGEAQKSRDFTQLMSSTSYQRAMEDMRRAGLNPMLAYAQGGAPIGSSAAASTGAPGGSAPTAGMAGAPGGGTPATASAHGGSPRQGGVQAQGYQRANIENALGPAVSSAMQGARFLTELEGLNATVDRTKAENALLAEQAHQVRANTALQVAQHASEGQRADLIRAQVSSEQRRPGQIAAATEAAESSAIASRAAAGASTAQAGYSGALTHQQRLESRQYEQYGPPSPVSRLLGTGNAVGQNLPQRAWEAGVPPQARQEIDRISEAIGRWGSSAAGWVQRQLQGLGSNGDGTAERLRRAHSIVR